MFFKPWPAGAAKVAAPANKIAPKRSARNRLQAVFIARALESRPAVTGKVKQLAEVLGADFQEEPIQPWREAELMVLYYSAGQGKEIRLRKFVTAAAHCTV
jgi:hypothetical protein